MQIALIGYGKMGHMIEQIAKERGHQIFLIINIENTSDFNKDKMKGVDVAIEFTTPESAFDNIKKCIDFSVPVVSGSTGWNERLEEIKKYCIDKKGTLLHTSNFSIGVNIFFQINQLLASLMVPHNDYDVEIKEIHHTQKKDAPSGTAVTLAEQILKVYKQKNKWTNQPTERKEELFIHSERIDPAAGTHIVTYSSDIDEIQIMHTAHTRKGFALGAVLAAEYIYDKKGVFTMDQVLGFTQ